MEKGAILSGGHWDLRAYKQRITRAEWRHLLLNDEDKIIFKGNIVQLKAKYLGAGVYEISKEEGE